MSLSVCSNGAQAWNPVSLRVAHWSQRHTNTNDCLVKRLTAPRADCGMRFFSDGNRPNAGCANSSTIAAFPRRPNAGCANSSTSPLPPRPNAGCANSSTTRPNAKPKPAAKRVLAPCCLSEAEEVTYVLFGYASLVWRIESGERGGFFSGSHTGSICSTRLAIQYHTHSITHCSKQCWEWVKG